MANKSTLFEIPRGITLGLGLLKKQKRALLNLIPKNEPDHILNGLVSTIDTIQDKLVDEHGYKEEDVFDFEERI